MSQVEVRGFQTEVKELLQLMIHSLYSNPEIFLRELISNASDACDKLRFEAVSDEALYEGEDALRIRVSFDEKARTVTLSDNGIGMNRDEVIENIGTIARSGTRAFIEKLGQDKANDLAQIGQFGVGFYSAFIVAEEVTLTTRRAGMAPEHGVRWVSRGEGEYSLETVPVAARGTTIELKLREDHAEFANDWRLRSVIRKYSDHITFPIEMPKSATAAEGENASTTVEWERVNDAKALWTRAKAEVADEEYIEFYKHVGHDWEAPLAWSHNRVEGKTEYISLLYLPARAPFDLWDRETKQGVKLYVKRVFIMDDADKLMPRYLRFVRGVIDSADLPLNVSREILQSNKILDTIRQGSVKRVLGMLEGMAANEPEKYAKFWTVFGQVLKEGVGEDFANRTQIAGLLRFATTQSGSDAQTVGLNDVVGRLQEGQDEIYYIIADSYTAAMASPHLEIFRKKGIEVILLWDRIDEWLMSHLTEFEGKKLKSVTKAELSLEDAAEESPAQKAVDDSLINRLKTVLGEKVEDVRLSKRLVDSPACLVTSDEDMSLHLQRLLKDMGQSAPAVKPILEINAQHPLLVRADAEQDATRFEDYARVIFGQAALAEGGQLTDAADFVQRMNRLLIS
ncbi:molecular chaperone HtpG [Halothiobacillus sp. DCM-1]|uniref:molecular chaperone HtpG n=1 Tax=Halothiobacillus sp. DCM-1 TaxID=3112558 RepID=UPI0032562C31